VLLHPPHLSLISDVTGAGDALAAGYIASYLQDLPIGQALRRGVAAAAITVLSPFAASPELSPKTLDAMLALVPEAEMLS
jgi:pseudouridine kinase